MDFIVERNEAGILAVADVVANPTWIDNQNTWRICLLYTSDAADE